jgi:hypothetical protein
MALDDIPVKNPASESEGAPQGPDESPRSVGPESETRGGPEAPKSSPPPSRRGPKPRDQRSGGRG